MPQCPRATRPRATRSRAFGSRCGQVLLLLACAGLLPGRQGRAEEPAAPGGILLATPETDVTGRLAGWLEAAYEQAARGAFAEAAAALAAALRNGADVPVADPVAGGSEAARREPVALLVERLAGNLPDAARLALAREVSLGARRLAEPRARRGDLDALELLARPPVLDPTGAQAMLALADHLWERGHVVRALALWRRYERLPHAPPHDGLERRIVMALARIGDEAALLERAAAGETTAGAPTPAAMEARRLLRELPKRAAARDPVPSPPVPRTLRPAWSLDLTDPTLRARATLGFEPEVVAPALVAEADALYLHDGRRVRRLDPLTGVERWTFPTVPLGWDQAPHAKYQPHDLPLRHLVRHGTRVLALLGDPGGTGIFESGEQDTDVDIDRGTRESRVRLVALEAATGALLWHTGALREPHPVLGDRATCATSPPLIVGNDVFVLLARRVGVAESYAACLDLATGRPRWVRLLAVGESGRDPGTLVAEARSRVPPVRALPIGQRPALEDGELCVVPHLGFAAGLEATDGRITWLRALPRFPQDGAQRSLDQGPSARNAPLAAAGAWVVAPLDCPVLVALERHTGRLRWQSPLPDAPEQGWRDVLGVAPHADGRPRVRVVGSRVALVDTVDGRVEAGSTPWASANDDPDGDLPTGRALDLGPCVALLHEGRVQLRAWPDAPPLDRSEVELVDAPLRAWPELRANAPLRGDLHAVGALWFALRPTSLDAFVDPAGVRPLVEAALAEASPEQVGALAATYADVLDEPAWLERAFACVPGAEPRATQRQALALLRWSRDLARREEAPALPALRGALVALAPRLDSPLRDIVWCDLAQQLPPEEAVPLLQAWIDAPPTLVGVPEPALLEGEQRVVLPIRTRPDLDPRLPALRSDLLAARLLHRMARLPACQAALAARAEAAAARIEEARASGDPAALGEALRRAVGTPALEEARRRLLAAARASNDASTAARLCADLRLSLAEPVDSGQVVAARARAASLQLEEAGWLLEAGDPDAARALLEDLRRWVPSGTRDRLGRTTSEVFDALRDAYGWGLRRGRDARDPLDLWPAGAGPQSPEERMSVAIPSVVGPGAGRVGDRFLLLRGLTPEIWSTDAGARHAILDGLDAGWFGGALQDAAPWLPERGVRVVSTVGGQPADRAGITSGDWLLAWSGTALEGTADLMRRIASSRVGEPVELGLLREGRPQAIRFSPQQRPASESRDLLRRDRVWADAGGALLLPTRTGLLRVDLARASAMPAWQLLEPGIVRSASACGGLIVLAIARVHEDDLVVAVDAATGRERWRTRLAGTVLEASITGSALLVRLSDTARTVVLDAADGSTRASLPEPARSPRPNGVPVVVPRETSGANAGRLYLQALMVEDIAGVWCVNTTTLASRRTASERTRARWGFERGLSVGAYVAWTLTPTEVRVYEPDPLSEGFLAGGTIGAGELLTEQQHHGGELDDESRVLARGSTIYVVRYRARGPGSPHRGVTVMTFGRVEDSRGRLRFTLLDHEPPVSRALGDLLLTHLDTWPDGLLVTAVARERDATGKHLRSVLWVPSAEGGLDERRPSPTPWEVSLDLPRRAGPARVGRSLFILTDEGARVVRVAEAR